MTGEEYLKKGEEHLLKEEYDQAVDLFTKAIAAGTSASLVVPRRAWALLKAGKPELAAEEFSKALELDPGNAHLYSERGVARLNQGLFTSAMLDFDRAREMEPSNPYRYASRGFLKERIGDLQGAHQDYSTALKLDPSDEITRNNLELLEDKMKYSRPRTAGEFDLPVGNGFDLDPEKVQEQHPGTMAYLKEIARVFTSREGFSEFINFLAGRSK